MSGTMLDMTLTERRSGIMSRLAKHIDFAFMSFLMGLAVLAILLSLAYQMGFQQGLHNRELRGRDNYQSRPC